MHKAEKIFLAIVIFPLSLILIFLIFYFLALPLYGRNRTSTYYDFVIKESWNGREGSDTTLSEENGSRDCFGEEKTVKCSNYNRKYEMCEIQCKGVLCGSCVKQGLLNELRCFQLYSR
jgi:hypothetical protein